MVPNVTYYPADIHICQAGPCPRCPVQTRIGSRITKGYLSQSNLLDKDWLTESQRGCHWPVHEHPTYISLSKRKYSCWPQRHRLLRCPCISFQFVFSVHQHTATHGCDQPSLQPGQVQPALLLPSGGERVWQSDMPRGSASCWCAGLMTVSKGSWGTRRAGCPGTRLQGPQFPGRRSPALGSRRPPAPQADTNTARQTPSPC